MGHEVSDDEARAALDEVARSRRKVVDEIDMPTWYWWGLAVGWAGLGVLTDLGRAGLTLAATLAFGAVHAAVSHWVLGGRRRTDQLSVRAEVAGRHVPMLVGLTLLGLAALTVLASVLAAEDGSGHPVTVASLLVAVLIVTGGPQLMRLVRKQALRSTVRW